MKTLAMPARVGFWLCVVLAVGDLPSFLLSVPEGTEGPPPAILVFATAMGVATLVAAVVALRTGSRVALRVMAATRILSVLTSLPAFFVEGVPVGFVVGAAIGVVLTVVAVVLLMGRTRIAGARSRTAPRAEV